VGHPASENRFAARYATSNSRTVAGQSAMLLVSATRKIIEMNVPNIGRS
jgi:hypothetical protein